MATTIATKSFEARDLHLKAVTVFADRAEVQREFSVDLEEGLTNVVVNNVSAKLDSGSIQVSASGTTIQKVELKKSKTKDAKVDGPKVKELLEEQKTLRSKLASKKHPKAVYDTRLETLNNIMTNVPLHSDYAVMGTTFGSLDELFNFHTEKTGQLNVLLQDVEADISELEPQVKDLQKQITKARRSEATQKSIVITLESATKAKVRMELTYQVTCAMWSPSYDLRVTSDPKSPTTKHAKLHYFATILQETGEDWNDVDIKLSTAEPRRAGSVPKLETLNATLRHRENPPEGRRFTRAVKYSYCASESNARPYIGASGDQYEPMNECAEESEGNSDEPTKFNQMRVEKHSLSSTFKVPQKTSIPSDSSEHKVTIACLEFDLLIGLECFPSVKTDVLETASALNDTKFPLLRGPAAVYVDHKFTSETTIHPAAVGEKFVFALGVDSDVKVIFTSTEPFRKQSEDERTSTSFYDKKVQLKNLKVKEKISVTVHLQVPKSKDGRINIELLEPAKNELIAAEEASTPKPPTVGPRLNADNILAWTVELDAGKERELVVKWSVQSPADEIVEFADQARAVDRVDD